MDTTRLHVPLDLKVVDAERRTIEGHAAVFGNVDKSDDVLDVKSVDRTLREKKPGDVAVFIGHNAAELPIGVPLSLRADAKGLHTITEIAPGAAGDELLSRARWLQSKGQGLGMSIGFYTRDFRYERLDGKTIRRLLEIDLVEYSFAARQTIANPDALVTAIKQAEDGRMRALKEPDADDTKAVWSAAEINNLPDSSFAYIEPGGHKDEEGKTVPRALRHFPHHNADGSVDLAHLRNALGRAPQSPFGDKALAHLERHAKAAGVGQEASKMDDAHAPEWTAGAAPALLVVAHKLHHLAEEIADEHVAMSRLGLDTKSGQRVRSEIRQKLRELIQSMTDIADWADYVETGQDGKANADWLRYSLALLEV